MIIPLPFPTHPVYTVAKNGSLFTTPRYVPYQKEVQIAVEVYINHPLKHVESLTLTITGCADNPFQLATAILPALEGTLVDKLPKSCAVVVEAGKRGVSVEVVEAEVSDGRVVRRFGGVR